MKNRFWLFAALLALLVAAAACAQAEPAITDVRQLSDGSLHVVWNDKGNRGPYRIVIQNVEGEQSFTRWTVATDVKERSFDIVAAAPGETYNIYVVDADNHYDMKAFTAPVKQYGGAGGGYRLTLTLRKNIGGRASTLASFSARDIAKSLETKDYYGATVKTTLPSSVSSISGMLRMSATLPNGETIVFMAGRDSAEQANYVYYDNYSFERLWSMIHKAYGEILQGAYRFGFYIDGSSIGYADFTVGK